jgi:hypothetical protein
LPNVSAILVERDGVRCTCDNLGGTSFDLFVPSLGGAGLRIATKTAQELESKLGSIFGRETKDLGEYRGRAHAYSLDRQRHVRPPGAARQPLTDTAP